MATAPQLSSMPQGRAGDLRGEFFTPEELGVALGVTTRTIARWESERIGPPRTRIGRRILYRRSSVAAWLAAQEANPAKPRRSGSR
jgi:hypothetical protein